jgi:hypothetical protein
MSRGRLAATLAILALAVILSSTACAPEPTTTVKQPVAQQSEVDTSSLTPLERGQARTAILKDVRAAIAAWQDSDAATMREYMTDDLVEKFESTWAGYEAEGKRIVHVQEQSYLDVIELNNQGTQALVTYRYDDDSYLVDSAGNKAGELEPFTEKEMQLTLDKSPQDEHWTIIRIIASENAYR